MTGSTDVRVEIEQGVATLIIDRPPVNALGTAELRAVRAAAERAAAGADSPEPLHALVVRAAGRGFGGGNDLADFPTDVAAYRAHVGEVQAMLEAVHGSPVLTVALVHGFCVGSSALLAAACDVVVAARSAWFRFPELEVGAPGGFRLLRERMPGTAAREVLLSCRRIPAEEAQLLGLADRVVADEELVGASADYLSRFGRGAAWDGRWLSELKSGMRRVEALPLWLGYAEELDLGGRLRAARREPGGG